MQLFGPDFHSAIDQASFLLRRFTFLLTNSITCGVGEPVGFFTSDVMLAFDCEVCELSVSDAQSSAISGLRVRSFISEDNSMSRFDSVSNLRVTDKDPMHVALVVGVDWTNEARDIGACRVAICADSDFAPGFCALCILYSRKNKYKSRITRHMANMCK